MRGKRPERDPRAADHSGRLGSDIVLTASDRATWATLGVERLSRSTPRLTRMLAIAAMIVLALLGLRISEAKTRIAHMSESLDFLGFRIQRRRKRGTSKWHVYTFIADRPIRSAKRESLGKMTSACPLSRARCTTGPIKLPVRKSKALSVLFAPL